MSRCYARLHLPNLSKIQSFFFPSNNWCKLVASLTQVFATASSLDTLLPSFLSFSLFSTQPSEVSFKIINHITSLLFSKPSSSSHLSQGQSQGPFHGVYHSIQSSPLLPFWPLYLPPTPKHTLTLLLKCQPFWFSWTLPSLILPQGLCTHRSS